MPAPVATSPELSALAAAVAALPLPGAGTTCEAAMAYCQQLRRLTDLLEAHWSLWAAHAAATFATDPDNPYDSPVQWLRTACHLSSAAAADRVMVGSQLGSLPVAAAAVADGGIGFGHLALIAHTAGHLKAVPGAHFDEERLVGKARTLNLGPFRRVCAHLVHAADPASVIDEERSQHEARFLHLYPRADGMLWIKAGLDMVAGAHLRSALEPLATRRGSEDDRSRAQRLADALTELSKHALDSGSLPQRGGVRPHLQVTASLETLRGLPGAPGADLEFAALPISAKALEEISCDCTLTRVVLGGESQVIDVGRAMRVISGPRRRALAARDGGCVWPGCERPAAWSTPHHLRHWSRGGDSGLGNQCLLCYHHHSRVHRDGWQMVRVAGGGWLSVPPPTGVAGPGQEVIRGPGAQPA